MEKLFKKFDDYLDWILIAGCVVMTFTQLYLVGYAMALLLGVR